MVQIIHRRIYFLSFLGFVKETEQVTENQKYIRFGNGGLTRKLRQFIDRIENEKYMIWLLNLKIGDYSNGRNPA